jgi:hypothetical protein
VIRGRPCDATIHGPRMTSDDQANGSGGAAGRLNWRSWQDAIRWSLSRSATIALLLSPIGLLLISVARVLIVSDYNTVTASVIVSSGGYVNTLLGTIIPVVPLFLPYLALVLLFFNRVILAILAMLATALVSPVAGGRSAVANLADKDWNHILGAPIVVDISMGLLAFVVTVLLLAVLLGLSFSSFARTVATIACIALIPFVTQSYPLPVGKSFYADLIRQPWLPAEVITFTSDQSIVGYVLADSGTTLTILLNDNRAIYYYPDTTVTNRQVCEIGNAAQMQPLIVVLPAGTGPSQTPPCSSAPGRSASGYSAQAGRPSQGRAGIAVGPKTLSVGSSVAGQGASS